MALHAGRVGVGFALYVALGLAALPGPWAAGPADGPPAKGATMADPLTTATASALERWSRQKTPLTTELVRNGQPAAVMVVPPTAAYRSVARSLNDALAARHAPRLPVVSGSRVDEGLLRSKHLIVLGDLSTNPVIERLYRELCCLVDRWYPGNGGFVVHTIHDPWGLGRNVLLLGGSDVDGVRAAERRLEQAIAQSGSTTVPRQFVVQLGPELVALHNRRGNALYPELPVNAVPFAGGSEAEGAATRYGYDYLWTGSDESAEQFVAQVLAAGMSQNHLFLWPKFVLWDWVEESPAVTGEQRAQVTDLLHRLYLSEEAGGNGTVRLGRDKDTPQSNHTTRLVLGAYFGARYFGRRFQDAQAPAILEGAARYYAAQWGAIKQGEDDCSDQFQGSLDNMAIYALGSGNLEWLASGRMRQAADRALLVTDNTAEVAAFGDAWRTYMPASLLDKAAYFYRDERYRYLNARRGRLAHPCPNEDPARSFATGLAPRVPDHLAGIAVAPADERFFRGTGLERSGFRAGESFDKLSLRSGFSPEADYLLLDGVSDGMHAYPDANSIVQLNQHGRKLVVTVDSQTGLAYGDHNVVTVMRDGEGAPGPAAARLEASTDFGATGFVGTFVAGYNGADWRRSIWWVKGQYFLVLDELVPQQAGDFVFRCRWRTLGEPSLDGKDFSCVQHDRRRKDARRDTLRIRCLGADSVRFRIDRHPSGKEPLDVYPYAEKALNLVSQTAAKHHAAGEPHAFANLLYGVNPGHAAEHSLARLESCPGAVLLDGGNLFGAGGPGRETTVGSLVFRARGYHLSPRQMCLAGATSLRAGEVTLSADRPVDLKWDLSLGRMRVRASAPGTLTLICCRTRKVALRAGWQTLTVQAGGIPASIERLLVEARGKSPGVPSASAPAAPPARPARPARLQLAWTHREGSPITALRLVGGKGAPSVIAGTESGAVAASDAAGRLLWRFQAKRRINAIDAAPGAGSAPAAVLVACDDPALYALSPEGALLWQMAPPPYTPKYPWWSLGAPTVVSVAAAPAGGAGEWVAFAGVGDTTLHCVDARGKPLWSRPLEYGVQATLAVADVDGDGAAELLAGDYPFSADDGCHVFSGDGREIALLPGDRWAGGTSAILVADVDGDGKQEVLTGTRAGSVRLYDPAPVRLRWRYDAGEEVRALAVADLDGDGRSGILVASLSSFVTALDGDGKRKWARFLEDEVVGMAVVPNAGVVAACRDGSVSLLDGTGAVVERMVLPSPLSGLAAEGGLLAAYGNDAVYGMAMGH